MKGDPRRQPRDQRLGDGAVIRVEPGAAIDTALKKFKRQCERAGLIRELRDRQAYLPPSARRRRKSHRARQRERKAAAAGRPDEIASE